MVNALSYKITLTSFSCALSYIYLLVLLSNFEMPVLNLVPLLCILCNILNDVLLVHWRDTAGYVILELIFLTLTSDGAIDHWGGNELHLLGT